MREECLAPPLLAFLGWRSAGAVGGAPAGSGVVGRGDWGAGGVLVSPSALLLLLARRSTTCAGLGEGQCCMPSALFSVHLASRAPKIATGCLRTHCPEDLHLQLAAAMAWQTLPTSFGARISPVRDTVSINEASQIRILPSLSIKLVRHRAGFLRSTLVILVLVDEKLEENCNPLETHSNP